MNAFLGLSFTGGWAEPKGLEGSAATWATGAEGLQVLQCHGREDSLCPVGFASACSDELRRLGCRRGLKSTMFKGR